VRHSLESCAAWPVLDPYLAGTTFRESPLTVETVWKLLDQVWDDLHIDEWSEADLQRYYRHPIWFLNGLVSEADDESWRHRNTAAAMARPYAPQRVLDAGGGYGSLLRHVAASFPEAHTLHLSDVNVDDPLLRAHLEDAPRVRAVAAPEPPYDVAFSIEVLEHLADPLGEVARLNQLLRPGGGLITSYSFFPMIRCHLPRNFHLGPLLHRLIPRLGFRLYGFERPGVTVWSFEKTRECTPADVRRVRRLAAWLRPLANLARHLR
jgi:2-polyprenyl-6-hydroxyphenyl methylase/3-demethylubiquinone-9 3-methyltransferase